MHLVCTGVITHELCLHPSAHLFSRDKLAAFCMLPEVALYSCTSMSQAWPPGNFAEVLQHLLLRGHHGLKHVVDPYLVVARAACKHIDVRGTEANPDHAQHEQHSCRQHALAQARKSNRSVHC